MPHWTRQIPDDPRGPALPILRTPAFKKLVAIVTSSDLVGTYTHYFKGRTAPCEKPDCEACRNGLPFRWHAYLAAEQTSSALHFIFETTAIGAEPFIDYREQHGTLRGCLFEAARWNNRPNGRILIRTKPADLTERRLPQGPDLTKCLAILWDLPAQDVGPAIYNPSKNSAQLAARPRKDSAS